MITCPWCGTSYTTFQSNCRNCGGPIPPVTEPLPARQAIGAPPPLAPRPIADSYAWKLLWSDGWAIAAFVFLLLGSIFTFVGFILTIVVVTAFVGIPFAILGLAMLAGGGAVGVTRCQQKRITVDVLRNGSAARGQVTTLDQNLSVSVNNAHPWTIEYSFDVLGQAHTGKVVTLKTPGPELQPGQPVWVLYLADEPQNNAIYPHP